MSDSTYNAGGNVEAGGDLDNQYPNPTVIKLQGRDVSSTAPTTGQVLKWDGAQWVPSNPS